MARMRFPGRPGGRVDRVGIHLIGEDLDKHEDPALEFVANLHKGLLEFQELCGDSEDETFEGFSENDLHLSDKRLRNAIKMEQKVYNRQHKLLHSIMPRLEPPPTPRPRHRTQPAAMGESSAFSSPKPHLVGMFSSPSERSDNSKLLSKKEILQKAIAAKQLLASLKAKHKHALQGRVIQKARQRGKSSQIRKSSSTASGKKQKLKKAFLKQKCADKTASVSKKGHGLQAGPGKLKLVSKRAERRKLSIETPVAKVVVQKCTLPPLKLQSTGSGRRLVKANLQVMSKNQKAQPKMAALSKDKQKQVVKQILQKAKGLNRPAARARSSVAKAWPNVAARKEAGKDVSQTTPAHKRNTPTFVLPQFSRSRRAIIPNKRFIEEDPIPSVLLVKRARMLSASSAELDSSQVLNIRPEKNGSVDPSSAAVSLGSAKLGGGHSMTRRVEKAKRSESVPSSPSCQKSQSVASGAKPNLMSAASSDSGSLPHTHLLPGSRSVQRVPAATKQCKSIAPASVELSPLVSATAESPVKATIPVKTSTKSAATAEGVTSPMSTTRRQHLLNMSPVLLVTPQKLQPSEIMVLASDPPAPVGSAESRKALLDQPLIVEGKRQRVPSLKVRLIKGLPEGPSFETEAETSSSASAKSEEWKQNGSGQTERFSLFPKTVSSSTKTFSRAGPMKIQRLDKDGKDSVLTKRSGQIMLRKAKLQLNRTAINRSKAALARSLKAQLKREAKQKGWRSEPQRHSPRPGVTSPLSISVLGAGAGLSQQFDSPGSQTSPLIASLSPGSQVGFASPPRIVSSLSPISLLHKKEPGETSTLLEKVKSEPAFKAVEASERERGVTVSGPRIKHVCRRAAVVLPLPLATFPAADQFSTPTLSALPLTEKEKLLQGQSSEREVSDASDEEKPAPKKRLGRPKGMARLAKIKKLYRDKHWIRRRKGRCKECPGCLAPPCGKCIFCKDSYKFGGANRLKKACINRKCRKPLYSKRATMAFIQPKSKGGGAGSGPGDEVDSSQPRQGPARHARPAPGFFAAMGGGNSVPGGGAEGGEESEGEAGRGHTATPPPTPLPPAPKDCEPRPQQRGGVREETDEGGGVNEGGGLEIMSAVRMQRHHTLTNHARRLLKRKQKGEVRVRLPRVEQQPQSMFGLTLLWSVPPGTRSLVHTRLKECLNINTAWKNGLSVTTSGPTCMRAVCFLCGCAGKEKMLYCSICCEPFHLFCLEEEDRPLENSKGENWVCRRCQFCHVCGLQTGLLQCDRCQDTYHPECLGPAYPKQPSRRNVWVCTKCVRCKSCGATTPGTGTNATWTYDFSLCFQCGKLMDKGNFCPVCRKCYADDDWESKMVQCCLCDSWVHAKCEGLTDEMYQLFSYLPEDIQYRCQVCCPTDPPEWRNILEEELLAGLRSVLAGLASFKCASHLLVIDESKWKDRMTKALQRKKPPKPQTDGCPLPNVAVLRSSAHTQQACSTTDCQADVIELSENDGDSPEKSQNKVSLVKAAEMSELSIFERLSQPCTQQTISEQTDSNSRSNGCSVADASEKKDVLIKKVDEEGDSKSSGLSEAEASLSREALALASSTDVAPHEAHLNRSQAAGDNIDSDLSLVTGAGGDNNAGATRSLSNMNIDCSEKTPASVSRNLFETFQTSKQSPEHLKMSGCPDKVNDNSDGGHKIEKPDLGDLDLVKKEADDDGKDAGSSGGSDSKPEKVEATQSHTTTLVEQNEDSHLSSCDGAQSLENGTVDNSRETSWSKALVSTSGRSFPRDFHAVKMKLDAGHYKSVEEFNEDMVHIIQTALSEDEIFPTRRRHSSSVKSVFIKQMEHRFPWFNVKACRLWQQQQALPQGMLPDAVVPPYKDHTYAQWLQREIVLTISPLSPFKSSRPVAANIQWVGSFSGEDVRLCVLCQHVGDDCPEDAGRLLYAGQDDWVHVNCALWSAEVFEESDGSLQNVHVAMVRGRQLRCNGCQAQGATVGCCTRGCPANYHFICARRFNCLFQDDKTVYCHEHRDQASSQVEKQKGFAVQRRVCVDMADIRCMKKSWAKGLDGEKVNVLFGSCTVESLGTLGPLSDCKGCLLPLEFRCSRVFWSAVDARQRTIYTCRIIEVRPSPATPELMLQDLRIVHDQNHPDYVPLSTLDLPALGLSHLLPVGNDNVQSVSPSFPSSPSSPGTENAALLGMAKCDVAPGDQGLLKLAITAPCLPGERASHLQSPAVSLLSPPGLRHVTSSASDTLRQLAEKSLCESKTAAVPQAGTRHDSHNTFHESISSTQRDCGRSRDVTGHSSGAVANTALPSCKNVPVFDYSRLSPGTLKLLNISDPKTITTPSHALCKSTFSPQAVPEFGNLMGMVARLNRAAMRSRSSSVEGQPQAGPVVQARCGSVERQVQARCSSVERQPQAGPVVQARCNSVERQSAGPLVRARCTSVERTSSVAGAQLRHQRSASLSPTGMLARSPSPFQSTHSVTTPLVFRKSPSPSHSSLRSLLRHTPSVTPILERLENDLAGTTADSGLRHTLNQTEKAEFREEVAQLLSLSSSYEDTVIDLTGEDDMKVHALATPNSLSAVTVRESSAAGQDMEVQALAMPDSLSPVTAGETSAAEELAIKLLETIHSEAIPEGSEVRLVVVPENMSEEEAIQLALQEGEAREVEGIPAEDQTSRIEEQTTRVEEGCILENIGQSNAVTECLPVSETVQSLFSKKLPAAVVSNEVYLMAGQSTTVSSQSTSSSSQSASSSRETNSSSSQSTSSSSQSASSSSQSASSSSQSTSSSSQSASSSRETNSSSSQSASSSSQSASSSSQTNSSSSQSQSSIKQPENASNFCQKDMPSKNKLRMTCHDCGPHDKLVTMTIQPNDLQIVPVYDKSGNLIGQHRRRPYVVNTVERTKNSIDFQQHYKEDPSLGDKGKVSLCRLHVELPKVDLTPLIKLPRVDITPLYNKPLSIKDDQHTHGNQKLCASDSEMQSKSTDALAGKTELADKKSENTFESVCENNDEGRVIQEIDHCDKSLLPCADLQTAVDQKSSTPQPEGRAVSSGQCSVKLQKLNLEDVNSCILVSQLCSLHCPKTTTSSERQCESRSKMCILCRLGSTMVLERERGMDRESEVGILTRLAEELKQQVQQGGGLGSRGCVPSTSVPVLLQDLKRSLMTATVRSMSSAPAASKFNLSHHLSGKPRDDLVINTTSKSLFNGDGEREKVSPASDGIMEKKKLLDIALHQPLSVSSIAESLRTVECRVSLEHLAARDPKKCTSTSQAVPSPTEATSVELADKTGNDRALGMTGNGVLDPPAAIQPDNMQSRSLRKREVGSDSTEQQPALVEGDTSALKATRQACSFNRCFLDFLKGKNDGSDSQDEAEHLRAQSLSPSNSSSTLSISSQSACPVPLADPQASQPQQSQPSGAPADVRGECLPLHTEIALRIKAESLARSSPGESGPVQCPKCKRLYRTAASCQAHANSCDFDVSTSDEEDDADKDDDDDDDIDGGSDDGDMPQSGENFERKGDDQPANRASMRQSTLTQRRAMESTQRQKAAMQAVDKVAPSPAPAPPPSMEESVPAKRGPGRPRKMSASSLPNPALDVGGSRVLRGKTTPVATLQGSLAVAAHDQTWSAAKIEQACTGRDLSPGRRGRGRPRRVVVKEDGQQTLPASSCQSLSPKESLLGAVGLVSRQSHHATGHQTEPSSTTTTDDAEAALDSMPNMESFLSSASSGDEHEPSVSGSDMSVQSVLTCDSGTPSVLTCDSSTPPVLGSGTTLTSATSTGCAITSISASKVNSFPGYTAKFHPVNSTVQKLEETMAKMVDSDPDSDIIFLDEDPLCDAVASNATPSPKDFVVSTLDDSYGARSSDGAKKTVSCLSESASGQADERRRVAGEIRAAPMTAEKERSRSPILSQLASSLLLPAASSSDLPDYGRMRANIALPDSTSHSPGALSQLAAGSAQSVTFTSRTTLSSLTDNAVMSLGRSISALAPVRTVSSEIDDAGSAAGSDNYKSSLLMSSANVEADIDSDDLSFTDSEEEESPTENTSQTTQENTAVSGTPQRAAQFKSECPKTPEQAQASHLLSLLDQLSPIQKMALTQQLLKNGALSIEDPPNDVFTPATQSTQLQHLQSLATTSSGCQPHSSLVQQPPQQLSVVMAASPRTFLSTPATQQVITATPAIRIFSHPSDLGDRQLAMFPSDQGIVMRQTPAGQRLYSPAQQTVQFVQQTPPIIVRQSLLSPPTSMASGVGLTPSSIVLSPQFSSGLSALGRVSAGTITAQGQLLGQQMLYSQSGLSALSHSLQPVSCPAPLLSQSRPPQFMFKTQPVSVQPQSPAQHRPITLHVRSLAAPSQTSVMPQQSVMLQPQTVTMGADNSQVSGSKVQPLLPALRQPSSNISYVGTLSAGQESLSNNDLEETARQQLLSLIRGAMSAVSQGDQTKSASSGTSVSQPGVESQSRVIRLVLSKSTSGDAMTARIASTSVTPVVTGRVAGTTDTPVVIGRIAGTCNTPVVRVLQHPSVTLSQGPAPLLEYGQQATTTVQTSAPRDVGLQQAGNALWSSVNAASQLSGYKRLASQATSVDGLPPAKRSVLMPAPVRPPDLASPAGWRKTPSVFHPMDLSSCSIKTHLSRATLGPPALSSGRAGTSGRGRGRQALLQRQGPGRRKAPIQVRQEFGQTAGPARTSTRGKSATLGRMRGRPRANKVLTGGPLSHPIVHLSHQAGAVLPQAEVEEEIEATPLRQSQVTTPAQQASAGRGDWPRDQPRLAFEITSTDGFSCRADSMEDAWRQVTDKVQDARAAARLKHLSYEALNGVQMFGVSHDSVAYLVEQLAGARHCRQYNFKYQEYEPLEEEELCINPSGSARCSQFTSRKPYDMFSFLMSRHRHRPVKVNNNTKEEEMEHKSARRATSMELPMAMRFRKLQEHAKEAVGVYRSRIHGRGLFCKRNIDNGEMVIEYSGEIIRSLLTDKREKYYEGKGIGCYMFRIDDSEVVDATMHGSAARFINHSCEPNCYSKVISVDGKKHIVIFANRAIKKGEELTYDYKFPIEDVKIPCTCGSRRCRKYLN